MLRYISYALPYILRAPRKNPVRKIAGLLFACFMAFMAVCFFLTAIFLLTSRYFGFEIAFVVLGFLSLVLAYAMLRFIGRFDREETSTIAKSGTNDPLAKFIPASIKSDPTVSKLLNQIGESPITATATAVSLGMLISKEIFED